MKKTTASLLLMGFICIAAISSCKIEKIKKEMHGPWLVEDAQYDGKSIFWEEFNTSVIRFNENGSCYLPNRGDWKDNIAKWDVVKKQGDYYLVISGAKDTIFNDPFLIKFWGRKQGENVIKVIDLRSEHLYLMCTE